MSPSTTESSSLIHSSTTAAATTTVAGAGMVNASTEQIRTALTQGPMTFRVMAFIGGLAMIVSNGIVILHRLFSLQFSGAMIATYGVIFGVIISVLVGPLTCSKRMQASIRYYAKFLEFTWGRGALYIFVASLQISNFDILDWAVGGWMMFVGITAIYLGISTSRQLKLINVSVKSEEDLKKKWREADADSNDTLDIKELTQLTKNARLEMSCNEIAAVFSTLGRGFDERISFEEFYTWWRSDGAYGARGSIMSV
jgi:hypothetical protein